MDQQAEWENISALPFAKRLELIAGNKIYHTLSSLQFNNSNLLYLFQLAEKLRSISENKSGADYLQTLLSHKRAVLYFGQPSTRTYLSFNNACQILGIKTSDIRSAAASSESKGESLEDTLSTFHSYTDIIIIRHANEFIAEKAAWMFNNSDKPIPIINAGSGPFEHPTQALLDIYTLQRAFNGNIDGKTVIMSGDLKRGRTIRSLTQILNNYKDIEIIYLAPGGLGLSEDVKEYLKTSNIKYSESDDFEAAIKKADVFYATRIQDEYDKAGESQTIDYTKFYLKPEHLSLMKKDAVILHPLPRRMEIDPAIDTDQRALYWKQEVNGLWIRAALIAQTFECDRMILDYKD